MFNFKPADYFDVEPAARQTVPEARFEDEGTPMGYQVARLLGGLILLPEMRVDGC